MKKKKKNKMCKPPCDTCGGNLTEEECEEMASHHWLPAMMFTLMGLFMFGILFIYFIARLINWIK